MVQMLPDKELKIVLKTFHSPPLIHCLPSLLSAQKADIALWLLAGFGQWGAWAGDWRERGGWGWHLFPQLLPCTFPVRQPLPHSSASSSSEHSFLLLLQAPGEYWCPTVPGNCPTAIFVSSSQIAQFDMPSLSCQDPQIHQLIIQDYDAAQRDYIFSSIFKILSPCLQFTLEFMLKRCTGG